MCLLNACPICEASDALRRRPPVPAPTILRIPCPSSPSIPPPLISSPSSEEYSPPPRNSDRPREGVAPLVRIFIKSAVGCAVLPRPRICPRIRLRSAVSGTSLSSLSALTRPLCASTAIARLSASALPAMRPDLEPAQPESIIHIVNIKISRMSDFKI